MPEPSGVRTGDLVAGERVTLSDAKGRRHSVVLSPGGTFHTTRGGISHDEVIGRPEGTVVQSAGGTAYLVFRPLLEEFTVTMPRGAAVVYPKDAAHILVQTDIFPGARVLEAGAGSGALSIFLLRAIGSTGRCILRASRSSPESRGERHRLLRGAASVLDASAGQPAGRPGNRTGRSGDLDMLAPWECVDAVADVLVPGGLLCCYVATTTQLGRTMDTLRTHGGFTEPVGREYTAREWHAEGCAIRPGHGTSGHTGFLIFTRRLAPGMVAPIKRRRRPPAYGPITPAPSAGGRRRCLSRPNRLGNWPRRSNCWRRGATLDLTERRLADAHSDARSLAQANEKLSAALATARESLVAQRAKLDDPDGPPLTFGHVVGVGEGTLDLATNGRLVRCAVSPDLHTSEVGIGTRVLLNEASQVVGWPPTFRPGETVRLAETLRMDGSGHRGVRRNWCCCPRPD